MPSAPARLKASKTLKYTGFLIQPTILCRCLQHRIFTADLIGIGWDFKLILNPTNDIEIRHTGLDHHHVSPFGKVKRNFFQCFI